MITCEFSHLFDEVADSGPMNPGSLCQGVNLLILPTCGGISVSMREMRFSDLENTNQANVCSSYTWD